MENRFYTEIDETAAAENLIDIIHQSNMGLSTDPDVEKPGITFRAAFLSFIAAEQYAGQMTELQYDTFFRALTGGFAAIGIMNYDTMVVVDTLESAIADLRGIIEELKET